MRLAPVELTGQAAKNQLPTGAQAKLYVMSHRMDDQLRLLALEPIEGADLVGEVRRGLGGRGNQGAAGSDDRDVVRRERLHRGDRLLAPDPAGAANAVRVPLPARTGAAAPGRSPRSECRS